MNNLKRFLALVLALSMMLTAVPFGVFATESTDPVVDVSEAETQPETTEPETEPEVQATEPETEPATEPQATEPETEPATEPQATEPETEPETELQPVKPAVPGTELRPDPDADLAAVDTESEIAPLAVTMGTKPADDTVTGEPFNDDASLSDNNPAHTNYRIPGLVMLNDGTLVASADIRYDYEYDGGGSDIVVSRSEDDGATWNYSVVAYLGDQGNIHAKNASTMMDPVLITDGETLYLLYDLFPAGYSLGGGDNTTYKFESTGTGFDSQGRLLLGTTYNSTDCGYYLENGKIYASNGTEQAGYTVDAWFNVYLNNTYVSNLFFVDSPFYAYPTSYACIQKSDDGGESWSDPEMLKTKHDGTKWQVLGPGSGIVTSSGELAFTVYNSDSSISLVHGTSGNWTTVKTYEAVNESSVVELSDGTIRAFVKNDDNLITYVDFTKSGDSYTAGNAQSLNLVNTGWCMISSMVYSKKIDGKEVILVCCPASSGLRRYGNVFAFTVDPTTKAMTKVGSYQIDTGYDDQFFAYSDMQELEDGTIALLYEDGCKTYASAPWNGSAAGSGYSHIALTNVDPEEDLSLTFGEESDTEDQQTDDAIVVYVDQTKEITLAGNLGTGSQNNDVANLTWSGTETTVKTAQAQLGTDANYSGDTINASECLYTFTANGDGFTVQSKSNPTLYLNTTQSSAAGFPNSTTSTKVTLSTGNAANTFYLLNADTNTGASYLHFYRNGNNYFDRVSTTNDFEEACSFFLYRPAAAGEESSTELPGYVKVTAAASDVSEGDYLIVAAYNNGYYLLHPATNSSGSKYAHVAKISGSAETTTTATTLSITGKTAGTTTVEIGGTTYTITVKNEGKEIILNVGDSVTDIIEGSAYTEDNAAVADESIATIDKVESTTVAATKKLVEVTDNSSFDGTKQYLIENIRAGALLTNISYTSSAANWIGTVTGLKVSGAASADSTELWTITASGAITRDNEYVSFGNKSATMTAEETNLTLNYTSSGWTIVYGNYYLTDLAGATLEGAFGATDANDVGNYWRIYEVVEEPGESSTEVTFTGHKIGTTTAQVGHVKYNITVKGDEREINLKVGETKVDTIHGVGYTTDNVTPWPNDTVAKLVSVTPTGAQLVPVTQIESGKQYLIVNAKTGDVLTNDTVTATSTEVDWGDKPGLETTGKAATDSTELWTITASGDGYTIVQDNKYLTASGFYAVMSDTETALTLKYTAGGWTIMDNTTCASLSGHDQADYYLSDNVGSGYDEAALGTSAMSAYCYWNIYEIDTVGSTKVTFTGVAPGNTEAVIGGVTYKITVEEDIRDIKLHKGQTQTFYIDGFHFTEGTINDSSIATLDSVVPGDARLVQVSELVSGEQYLIVNVQTGEVLTDTPIILTGDADSKDALVTEGTASVDNTELWTITGDAINGYTVSQNGKYLTVAGYYAAMSDTVTALKLTHSNTGWMICDNTTWESLGHNQADYYLRNGIADANYAADALGSSITSSYSYWNIYKIDTTPVTEVTFTGVQEGSTVATVGHVTFNITVDNVVEGDIEGFNNIVGVDSYTDGNSNATYRSDLDMAGKTITSLRITEGASFHLGVDVTDYDSVTWSVADTEFASVDANGYVTAKKAGETLVTATVIKDGKIESISIPVTVVPSLVEGYSDSEITSVFYYIEQVDDTDPYYTMFLDTESTTDPVEGHRLIKVSEGEVIWYERPTESAFAWVWTADPWEGYALTKMGSSGSIDEYYPLRDVTDISQLGDGYVDVNGDRDFDLDTDSEYYYTSATFTGSGAPNNAYKNVVLVGNDAGASWRAALDKLLEESILIGKNVWPNYGCDGAMSNTRWADGDHGRVPKIVTAMTFISDPMPQITKAVNGILPTTRLQKDFRRYKDGMTATVGEYVYFDVTVTLERPTVWKDEAGGIGAITYTDAFLTDTVLSKLDAAGNYLSGAYFYTKEDDMDENGVLDGVVPAENRKTKQDLTDALNKAWVDGEEIRTLNFYVIYEIQEGDIPKFHIENTANLAWNYQSHYSTGALSGAADAEATITVVGTAIDDVVIDFGQSVTYTGLTNEHLKYVFTDDDEIPADIAGLTAKYGTVQVTKVQQKDASGTLLEDEKHYPLYDYTVTYTPTTILKEPDVVQLYGSYVEGDETVVRMINSFTVYPATTVYYEEGFMFDGETEGWTGTGTKATMKQTFERLGESVYDSSGTLTGFSSDKKNPYGYDPIYAGDYTKSSASTETIGANTTFTFTGTGFDLYANCGDTTGYVSVMVKDAAGKVVKLYNVNTMTEPGSTGATSGQNGNMDSLPIVSEQGLEHGTYTVTVRKVKDSGAVILDGVRIFNTVNEAEYVTEDSPFKIDLEDGPEFYQLRDYVLMALGIGENTSVDYDELPEQVYAMMGADQQALILSATTPYGVTDSKVYVTTVTNKTETTTTYADGSKIVEVVTVVTEMVYANAERTDVLNTVTTTEVDKAYYNANGDRVDEEAFSGTGESKTSETGKSSNTEDTEKTITTAQDLLDKGPKNEIYLHANETLVFNVTTKRMMQIGLKAPVAATEYSISYTLNDVVTTVAENQTMDTSVDMFYELNNAPLANAEMYTITITNNGSNILSVTDLKICDDPNVAFNALSAADIEVALKAMGYTDPCEEGHSYENGACTVCGSGAFLNVTTSAAYTSLDAALKAAAEDETVQMLADWTCSNVLVPIGVTLDLNGSQLTADYAVAFDSANIIDSLSTGRLVIAVKNLVLTANNAMVPWYDGDGYRFTRAGFAMEPEDGNTGDSVKIKAMVYPLSMDIVNLLSNGAADNNIEMVIQLTWDTDQGTGSQELRFNDDVVQQVYSSNLGSLTSYGKMFVMTITGCEGIQNLKANMVIVSGTNARYASSKPVALT